MKIIFTFPENSSYLLTDDAHINTYLDENFTNKKIDYTDIQQLEYLKNYFRVPIVENYDNENVISKYYNYIFNSIENNSTIEEDNENMENAKNFIVTNEDFSVMNLNTKVMEKKIIDFLKDNNYTQLHEVDLFLSKNNINSYTNQLLNMVNQLKAQFTDIVEAVNPSDKITELLQGHFIPEEKLSTEWWKFFALDFIRVKKSTSVVNSKVIVINQLE